MNNDFSIFVSVIMCEYNTKEEYLREAIESVLNQTYRNFELIIVDDGSDDYPKRICEEYAYQDKRIVLIHQCNKGLAAARNAGIDIAKGKYILLMDTDDVCLPYRLEKQVKFIEDHPEVVVAGTWFKFIGDKTHEVKRIIDDHEYYRCSLLFGNAPTIINPSTIIRKSALDRYNIRYDEKLRYAEDYDMWYQLSKVGRITNIKEVLLYYRYHDRQASFRYNNSTIEIPYVDMVRGKMLSELKITFNKHERDLFFNFIHANKWNANGYIKILQKLLVANKVTKIYKQDKLELRVHEQWICAVQNVKNPFKIISLLFKQKGDRKEIIKIKWSQLIH